MSTSFCKMGLVGTRVRPVDEQYGLSTVGRISARGFEIFSHFKNVRGTEANRGSMCCNMNST